MKDDSSTGAKPDVIEVYRRLRQGGGRELVDDDNVFQLIEIAAREGHRVLEQELREWQSPCNSPTGGVTKTIAPTKGFNKENVKH